MGFLALSNEILLSIAELGHDWDTASLSHVNRHLYFICTRYLYKKDVRNYVHPTLRWTVEKGNPYTVRKRLGEARSTDLPGENDIYYEMGDAARHGHEAVLRVFLENWVSPNKSYGYGDPLYLDMYPWQAHCLRTEQRSGTPQFL